MKGKVIEGVFLRPTPKESALIWDAVREAKLPENGEGVLKLLLQLLREDKTESDPAFDMLQNYLKANPGVVMTGANLVASILSKFKPK